MLAFLSPNIHLQYIVFHDDISEQGEGTFLYPGAIVAVISPPPPSPYNSARGGEALAKFLLHLVPTPLVLKAADNFFLLSCFPPVRPRGKKKKKLFSFLESCNCCQEEEGRRSHSALL